MSFTPRYRPNDRTALAAQRSAPAIPTLLLSLAVLLGPAAVGACAQPQPPAPAAAAEAGPPPAASEAAPEEAPQAAGERPAFQGAEWQTATPASQGLDSERLARGIERLGEMSGVRSLLVVRNARIVAGESFAGRGLNERHHDVKSASKSLLSALIGIALDEGSIESREATVGELLPGYAEDLPEGKRAITVENLLTMSSGLASTSGEHYGAWVSRSDWTAGALARPLEHEPGQVFTYSTGNTHLLSAILTEATGKSTFDFAREKLFEPLGIEVHSWQRSPEGYYFGGNSLAMTPRDLARFGQLYLQEGRWGDRQIVPEEWVERSTRLEAEGWPERYGGYGYLWWLAPADPWKAYAAVGYGGQFLCVVPELDMLIVMTSTHQGKGAAWDREVFEILWDDVFGAASSG